ncbi:MAG: MBL fold metallo-hydrolase, partial [Candidatus Nanoarchaeia archaeon]
MITKLRPNLWRLDFRLFGSIVYILKHNGKIIIIDTGSFANRPELKRDLKELNIRPENVDIVLLTHKHFDHDGNIKIFENAKIYGSKEDFKSDKILDVYKLNIKGLRVIKTPGHSRGSVCFLLNTGEEKTLFSGDTIFNNGYIGRTDLPGSNPEDMKKSLEKLKKIDYGLL